MLKWALFFLPLFCLIQDGLAIPWDQYKLTRWQDPLGRSPLSFEDFQRDNPPLG